MEKNIHIKFDYLVNYELMNFIFQELAHFFSNFVDLISLYKITEVLKGKPKE